MKNTIKTLMFITAICTTASSFAATEAVTETATESQRTSLGIKTLLATDSDAMENLNKKLIEAIEQVPTKISSETERWEFAKKIFITEVENSLKPVRRWARNTCLCIGGFGLLLGAVGGVLIYKTSKPGGNLRRVGIPVHLFSSLYCLGGSIYCYNTITSCTQKRHKSLIVEFLIYLSENVDLYWENCKKMLPKQIIDRIEKIRDSKEKFDLYLESESIAKEIKMERSVYSKN